MTESVQTQERGRRVEDIWISDSEYEIQRNLLEGHSTFTSLLPLSSASISFTLQSSEECAKSLPPRFFNVALWGGGCDACNRVRFSLLISRCRHGSLRAVEQQPFSVDRRFGPREIVTSSGSMWHYALRDTNLERWISLRGR